MALTFNPFTGNLDYIGTGGGASVAGSNTEIQYNNSGSLGASADLTWDDTGKVLGVGGDVDLDDGGTYTTTLQTITATANRTISFPDATGTVGLVAGSSGQLLYNSAGANAGVPSSVVGATGDVALSLAGAASTPPLKLSGTWFSGGTATTTKPQVLIEPAGTTSTAWSTSGTGLGVNAASGFTGNLLDLQVNGASQFRVAGSGAITGKGGFSVLSDGVIHSPQISIGTGASLNSFSSYLALASTYTIKWSSTTQWYGASDLILARDAADTLAQRNGTNAQTYRLYNTYTDASNYQRTSITDDSTGLVIDQQYAGTGAARTNLLDLKVNGSSLAAVTNAGTVVCPNISSTTSGFGGLTIGLNNFAVQDGTFTVVRSDHYIGWSDSGQGALSGGNTRLYRDNANNTIAQRNSTNAQTYRLYNTYTDASNYERASFKWDANTFKIEPEAAGTGTLRGLAFPANAGDSTPPVSLTGTWFSGGTSTTTKPQLLIEPTGTTSTAWNTSGTGLGVNAPSGFAGNLLDLQANGASGFVVSSFGRVVAGLTSSLLGGDHTFKNRCGNNLGFLFEDLTSHCSFRISYYGTTVWGSGAGYGFSSAGGNPPDLKLVRDAAGTLAQRNGTNAQTYRLYNSYTDGSNYQRTSITDDSTGLVIDQQYAGTGAARTNLLDLKDNGTSKVTVSASGSVQATVAASSSNAFGTNGRCAATGGVIGGSNAVLLDGLLLGNALSVQWSSTSLWHGTKDLGLARDSAGVVAITDGSTGTGYLKQTPVAVSALPAAATVGAGTRGFVSDSTVAASGNFGATVTGGGSNNVPVFSDGTNWLIG